MKTLLMVFSKYSIMENDPYLTNDLVNEICKQGHRVIVVAYGDSDLFRNHDNLEEHIIGVSSSIKFLKYVIVWPKLAFCLANILWKNRTYDQILVQAPMSVKWPASLLVHLAAAKKKTAMIFDIYPSHQAKINALPAWAEGILRLIELFLLKTFNEITAMGQNNKQHIQKYYFKKSNQTPIKVIYLWGQTKEIPKTVSNYNGTIKLIFGGQIIKGRSINRLIEFLDIVRKRGMDLTLSFYSTGKAFEDLKRQYSDSNWLFFYDRVSRNDYTSLLRTYHVGTVVTDERANLPAFPSKVIDYLTSGLCCFCLVEQESELYNVVNNFQRVYINSFDFSEEGIQSAIQFFHTIQYADTQYEVEKISQIFSVSTAASKVLA